MLSAQQSHCIRRICRLSNKREEYQKKMLWISLLVEGAALGLANNHIISAFNAGHTYTSRRAMSKQIGRSCPNYNYNNRIRETPSSHFLNMCQHYMSIVTPVIIMLYELICRSHLRLFFSRPLLN